MSMARIVVCVKFSDLTQIKAENKMTTRYDTITGEPRQIIENIRYSVESTRGEALTVYFYAKNFTFPDKIKIKAGFVSRYLPESVNDFVIYKELVCAYDDGPKMFECDFATQKRDFELSVKEHAEKKWKIKPNNFSAVLELWSDETLDYD